MCVCAVLRREDLFEEGTERQLGEGDLEAPPTEGEKQSEEGEVRTTDMGGTEADEDAAVDSSR